MKKRVLLLLSGSIISMLLFSCSGPPRIGYSSANMFVKGVDYQKVVKDLDRDPFEETTITLKSNSAKYKVLIFRRWIRTYSGEGSLFYSDKFDLFVYSFLNEKLAYVGNLDDLKRSDDTIENELADGISQFWLKQ